MAKRTPHKPEEGRRRVLITNVTPELDGGRYPIKRTPGEAVRVEADVLLDGRDVPACLLLHRVAGRKAWREVPMIPLVNDRWFAQFLTDEEADYEYTILCWINRFETWRRDTLKKVDAGLDVKADLLEGALQLRQAAAGAPAKAASRLRAAAKCFEGSAPEAQVESLNDPVLSSFMLQHDERRFASHYSKVLRVQVDRPRAAAGAWYEMFPRSAALEPGRHGTLRDCIRLLPYVAGMGFDVLYLPPVHPIGGTGRKGKNNTLAARPGDPGSPWAIGSAEGGHQAVAPELGTLDDFCALVSQANRNGLEVALDIAFQCSPNHPWVTEHPDWFYRRPDGSIHHAENPPKKYEDIYPINFECDSWPQLWEALRDIFLFWYRQGVRIFRVDNPHTKPFDFWEWCLADVRARCPGAIFLSEAFTRPKIMYHLAKIGFTQSYTYFAWRNTRWELTEYFKELSSPPVSEFFRPSLWTNTPDILTEYLQAGGRPAFAVRFLLASTLGANYGIYGPAFELMQNRPREHGSEEYLDSEKYEIRSWDRESPGSLRGLITRINEIRRENPALLTQKSLKFHPTDNEYLLAYSKRNAGGDNIILTVVNLDPHYRQSGWIDLDLEELGIQTDTFQVHDLLGGGRYLWSGSRNYVELDPQMLPGHVLKVLGRARREGDFDYYD